MSNINKQIDDLFGNTEKVEVSHVTNPTKRISKPGMTTTKLKINKKALLTVVAIGAICAGIMISGHLDGEAKIAQKKSLDPHLVTQTITDRLDAETKDKWAAKAERIAEQSRKNHGDKMVKDGAFAQTAVVNEKPTELQKKSSESEVNPALINKISPTYVSKAETLKKIEDVTAFDIPKDLTNNKVAAWVIKETANRADFKTNEAAWLLATTMHRESFVSHVYNDVGWASIGAGQTVGVQSKKSVETRFNSVGVDKATVDFLASLSNKRLDTVQLPSGYKNITITGQQGSQLSLLQIYKDFQPGVITSIGTKSFDALSVNETTALTGLAYQKGSIGQKTSNAVKEYADFKIKNPNANEDSILKESQKVVNTFTMNYTVTGKDGVKRVIEDVRSLGWAATVFQKPDAAQKIMSNTLTPKETKQYSAELNKMMASRPGANKSSEATSVSFTGELQVNDPIQELKSKAASGEITLSVNKESMQPEVKKSRGFTDIRNKM